AVRAAGGDDGNLPLEGNEPFENEPAAAHGGNCAAHHSLGCLVEYALALAVVAHAARLEHAIAAEPGKPLHEIVIAFYRDEGRRRDAERVEKNFLRQPVLGRLQRLGEGMDGHAVGKGAGRDAGNILEFVGDHVAGGRKLLQPSAVLVGGCNVDVRNLSGGAVGLRIQHRRAVAEPGCRHGQHAAELAAADNSDCCAGWKGFYHVGVIGRSGTFCDWAARQASKRAASASSESASTAAASSAALTAPARPIASVPTGMPAGICTMERSDT